MATCSISQPAVQMFDFFGHFHKRMCAAVPPAVHLGHIQRAAYWLLLLLLLIFGVVVVVVVLLLCWLLISSGSVHFWAHVYTCSGL